MKRDFLKGIFFGLGRVIGATLILGVFLYYGIKPEDFVASFLSSAPSWTIPIIRTIALIIVGAFGFWIIQKLWRSYPFRDHWAERDRVEISVLANVSTHLPATHVPINKDPENARFRQLKDAVNTGELKAVDMHGDRANAMTSVTIDAFERYARKSGKKYWLAVLRRWEKKQSVADERR